MHLFARYYFVFKAMQSFFGSGERAHAVNEDCS